MAGHYQISKNDGGQFHFVLVASNGQTILSSQTYASKDAAKTGIASVLTNSPLDDKFDRKEAKDGSPFFNLLAANGQIIGTSQMYASAASRDAGIASVKSHGSTTDIRE